MISTRRSFRDVPRASSRRRGVAAVEFAFCLPVLIVLVLGSIQASNYIFFKQTLHTTAYEAARSAARRQSTNILATRSGENILKSRRVKSASIRFNVPDVSRVERGTPIEVRVSAPTDGNTPLAGSLIRGRTLEARVVMVKE